MIYPDYSCPPGLVPSVALDVVLLCHRNFHQDAKVCIEHLKPPLEVLGKENMVRPLPVHLRGEFA
jgi:hypothetical protein